MRLGFGFRFDPVRFPLAFINSFFLYFLFAFIGFNPCFTISVYHGIFTEVVQLIPITNLPFRF